MKLSELIEKYGDDNIIFQNLDNDLLSMDKKKNHYEYKFGSKEPFNFDGTQKRALVVWLDREKTQQILDSENTKEQK